MSNLTHVGTQRGITRYEEPDSVIYDDAALPMPTGSGELHIRVHYYGTGEQVGILNYCGQIRLRTSTVVEAIIKTDSAGNTVTLTGPIPAHGRNIHIGVEATGSLYRLWLNGVMVASTSNGGGAIAAPDNNRVVIGHFTESNSSGWDPVRGVITELRALTDVLAIHQRRESLSFRLDEVMGLGDPLVHAYFPMNTPDLAETESAAVPVSGANQRFFAPPIQCARVDTQGGYLSLDSDSGEIDEFTNFFVDFIIQRNGRAPDETVADIGLIKLVWNTDNTLGAALYADDSSFRDYPEDTYEGFFPIENVSTGSRVEITQDSPRRIGFGIDSGFNAAILVGHDGFVNRYEVDVSPALSLKNLYIGPNAAAMISDLRLFTNFDRYVDVTDVTRGELIGRTPASIYQILHYPMDLPDPTSGQLRFANCNNNDYPPTNNVELVASGSGASLSSRMTNVDADDGTLVTYDASGNVTFNGGRYQAFIIDELYLTGETTVAYPNVVTRVGCQLISNRDITWSGNNGTGIGKAIDNFEQPMTYSVSYANGYPEVTFSYTDGTPGHPHRALVFSWGEPI